jgi:hypothetical protein
MDTNNLCGIGDCCRYRALAVFCTGTLRRKTYLRYQKTLGIQPSEIEHQRNGSLPQWYADEFGWPEMVEKVARVYNSLSPEEQMHTAIFSNGWGEQQLWTFTARDLACPWLSANTTVTGSGVRVIMTEAR